MMKNSLLVLNNILQEFYIFIMYLIYNRDQVKLVFLNTKIFCITLTKRAQDNTSCVQANYPPSTTLLCNNRVNLSKSLCVKLRYFQHLHFVVVTSKKPQLQRTPGESFFFSKNLKCNK